jgi:hypothetical protein
MYHGLYSEMEGIEVDQHDSHPSPVRGRPRRCWRDSTGNVDPKDRTSSVPRSTPQGGLTRWPAHSGRFLSTMLGAVVRTTTLAVGPDIALSEQTLAGCVCRYWGPYTAR